MGKKNQNISSAKKGMIRDAHPSGLPEGAYTDALNNNIEDESGNGIPSNQNEHSNILCTTFKDGYKVVGHVKDELDDRTYFFLTNPDTGKSEIGYVPEINFIENEDDIEYQCGCDFKELLNEALENTKQKSTCRYTTVIDDGCNSCLNFSIDHPIRNPILKVGKTSKTLYFTDGLNPQRYIDLSNLSKYKEVGVGTCSETLESTCLDCNKLLIFPKGTIPCLTPEVISGGGNLVKGTYEAIICYSNAQGEELSNYYSVTTPVSIFDLNNLITDESMLSDRINRSIRFSVKGLDTQNFGYYKIVIIQRTDIAIKYFINGVYTIDNTSFVLDTDENKTSITKPEILSIKPYYTKANGITEFNGTLMQFNLEKARELNLQPVVNLMSAFLKWQTHQAKEDLYAKGISASKYRGYMRDEVYPFSIQFETDYNYVTTKFPLVGRPPTEEELLPFDIDSNDYLSTNKYSSGNCSNTDRLKTWQYENTATKGETCQSGSRDCENSYLKFEDKQKYCLTIGEDQEGEQIILPIEDEFIDLETYMDEVLTKDRCLIQNYPSNDEIYQPSFQYLCEIFYDPYELNEECKKDAIQQEFIDEESVYYDEECGDTPNPVFIEPKPIDDGKTERRNILGELDNVVITKVKKDCLEYRRVEEPIVCSYRVSRFTSLPEEGTLKIDQFLEEISNLNFYKKRDDRYDIYERNATYEADENIPTPIPFTDNLVTYTPLGIALDFYYGDSQNQEDIAKSVEEIQYPNYDAQQGTVEGDDRDFEVEFTYTDKLHKNAVFFEGKVIDGKIIIELSKSTFGAGEASIPSNKREVFNHDSVRVGVYKTDNTKIISEVYDNLQNNRPGIICISASEHGLEDGDTFKATLDSPYTISTAYNPFGKIKWLGGRSDYYFSFTTEENENGENIFRKFCDDLNGGNANPLFNQLNCGRFDIEYVGQDDDPFHFNELFNVDFDNLGETVTNQIFLVVPNQGCFAFNQRGVEYKEVTLKFDKIRIDTEISYTASCPIIVPILNDCDPTPYKRGGFSYWESVEKYPDNCELYDSSDLNISSEDLPEGIRDEFSEFFTDGTVDTGDYNLLEKKDIGGEEVAITNLSDSPIRHYKFPSNTISPFITEGSNLDFREAVVYPIGVTLDKEVINAFLDIAVKNNLITQQERDGIKSFKIYRGDRSSNKSIKAKGLLYDMRTYEKGNQLIHYSNYPYNDLGDDILHTDDNGGLLQHPYGGNRNNRFTFHSPDYHFENPSFGTEIGIEAYMYGKSRGTFNKVEGHPKWIMLSDNARDFATALAIGEEAIETALKVTEILGEAGQSLWFTAGTSSGTGAAGFGFTVGEAIATGVTLALGAVSRIGRLNFEWQQIFRNLGSPRNFADFYSSVGEYNYIVPNDSVDDNIRGISSIVKLKSGKFRLTEGLTGGRIQINHNFREWATFISLGDGDETNSRNSSPDADFINYPEEYIRHDNYNRNKSTNSRTIAFDSFTDCGSNQETFRNIASPYVSIKDYLPSQYGGINDIIWTPINHCGTLTCEDDDSDCTSGSCQAIFGGDVYISRMTLKRKVPMFTVDAMKQASLTPFQYDLNPNIGKPRYYINYEVEGDERSGLGSAFFPRIKSDIRSACKKSTKSLYYAEPTNFYLYYYGIPSFLVESEINLNYRYAKREEFEQFYPQRTDYDEWTQETNMSIREQNTYFHNRVYSYPSSLRSQKGTLLSDYNREEYDSFSILESGVIQSNKNSWLVYEPNKEFEFPTKYGKLIDLTGIESQMVLGRFEDQSVVYNRVDNINDKLLNNQSDLTPISVFTRSRTTEFAKSDLGYSGTQNTALVSCQLGYFWVDAKRGQVFHLLPNASNLKEISNLGMRNWFKEHMPFKILKGRVKNLTHSDLDNNYKGLGITMAWDDRYRRVFITKLDYKIKKEYVGKLEYKDNNFFYGNLKLSLKDKRYFEDTSFTIAYSPVTQGWVSFYSYKPNYYIEYNNYFQSGMNFATDSSEEGLWSHLLTNRSYQVFYGKLYPWRIEYPVKEQYVNKKLESIQYWLDSKRYHNDYDFAENREIGFDKLWIYNNSEITGELRLNRQKTIRDISKYPKTAPDGSYQDILVTEYDKRWNVNNFYNRTKDENNNVPLWNWDANQIDKTMNTKAVSFKGKRIKERLRGDWFLVRLEQTLESRYKTILKWGISKEDIYNQ